VAGAHISLTMGYHGLKDLKDIGRNLYTSTCLSPLTLLTPVHWGTPLHLIGLTSEVSVVGAPASLTMGYHFGPSADLIYPESVCVQNPSWNAVTCPIEDTL